MPTNDSAPSDDEPWRVRPTPNEPTWRERLPHLLYVWVPIATGVLTVAVGHAWSLVWPVATTEAAAAVMSAYAFNALLAFALTAYSGLLVGGPLTWRVARAACRGVIGLVAHLIVITAIVAILAFTGVAR